MKNIFLSLILTVAIFANKTSVETNKETNESIVIVVNNTNITKNELDREIGRLMPKNFYHSTVTDDKLTDVKKKAQKALIDRTLLYQYSKKIDIKVSKDELDKEENTIIKSFGSKNNFNEALKKANITKEKFKKELEKDIALQKLYDKEIKVEYSDDDLKKYYKENTYKFKLPEKIRIRQIYIKIDPTDPTSKEKTTKLINEINKKLKKGENFADLAAKHSSAMSRIKGGDMGFIHKGRIDEKIEKIAFALDINETSDIIKLDIGYYIVKVEDKKPSIQLSFEKVKKSLKRELIEKNETARKKTLLKKLKSKAKIEIK